MATVSKDAKALGKKYITEVLLPMFPAEAQDAAKKVFESDGTIERVGQDLLKQEEFNRLADESRKANAENTTWKSQLDGWWDRENAINLAVKSYMQAKGLDPTNKQVVLGALSELFSGKAIPAPNGGGNGDGNREEPSAVTKDVYTKKEVEDLFNARFTSGIQGAAAQVIPHSYLAARLAARHMKQFDEELDFDAVTKICSDRQVPLEEGYKLFIEPKIKEREDKKAKDELAAAERRGYERGRTESAKMPFPTIGGPDDRDPSYDGPSPLTGLTLKPRPKDDGTNKDKADFSIAEAVKTYHEELGKRMGT